MKQGKNNIHIRKEEYKLSKFVDLTGRRFDFLVVEERIENRVSSGGNSFVQYRCKCDCGRYKNVLANKLKSKHTRSCGQCDIFSKIKDLTGRNFDKLTVIRMDGFYEYPSNERDYKWFCECECGGTITIRGNILKAKGNHSCNCFRHQRTIQDEDMLNRKFDRLTVIRREKDIFTKTNTVIDQWLCRCECDTEIIVRGAKIGRAHV